MGKKTRGRLKIKMEYISDKLKRYTTFSKRRSGIMKKAYELSTLTGTEVLLLVASETGHVYTYATDRLKPIFTSDIGRQLIQQCLGADASANVATNETIARANQQNLMNDDRSSNDEDEDSEEEEEDSDVEEMASGVGGGGGALNNQNLLQPSIAVSDNPKQAGQVQKVSSNSRKNARKTSQEVKVEPIFGTEPNAKQRRIPSSSSSFAAAIQPSPSTSSLTSPGTLLAAAANGHLYFVNDPSNQGNGMLPSAIQQKGTGGRRENNSMRILPGSFMTANNNQHHNGHHHLAASSSSAPGISVYEQGGLFISTSDPIMHNQSHLPQRTQLPSHSSSVSSSNSSSVDNNNSSTNNNNSAIISSRTFSK